MPDEAGLALRDRDVDHRLAEGGHGSGEPARRERFAQERRVRDRALVLRIARKDVPRDLCVPFGRHEREERVDVARLAERLPGDAREHEIVAEARARRGVLEREQTRPREGEARLGVHAQHLALGVRSGRDVGDHEDERKRHRETIRQGSKGARASRLGVSEWLRLEQREPLRAFGEQ
jgi:hypothetical protein